MRIKALFKSSRPFALACVALALGQGHAEESRATPFLATLSETGVEWRSWSPETRDLAEKEQRPLFFFVAHFGNSLARAMTHETFGNATIVETLNQSAVSVLVDSHEEPELAAFLVDLAQANFGADDYPICLWTTPDLEPISGGGYFPPTDDWGGQGFISLARKVAEQWHEARNETVRTAAARMRSWESRTPVEAKGELLNAALESAMRPQPDAQNLRAATLWALARSLPLLPDEKASQVEAHLAATIERIALNSGFDPIDGGFFIGSNDPNWRLPLFQKSAADQALMLLTLAALQERQPSELYSNLLRLTTDFVERRLIKENGLALHYFDSFAHGEGPEALEGSYYLFDAEDVAAASPAAATLWSLQEAGNLDSDTDILGLYTGQSIAIAQDPAALADSSEQQRKELLAARSRKPAPAKDGNAYVATNALLVSAFASISKLEGKADALNLARSIYDSLEKSCASGDTLYNSDRQEKAASSQAYAFLIAASLDLNDATGDSSYLERAAGLQHSWKEDARFAAAHPPLFRIAEDPSIQFAIERDHALPSVVGARLSNQARLANRPGDSAHREAPSTPASEFGANAAAKPAQYLSLFLENYSLTADGAEGR